MLKQLIKLLLAFIVAYLLPHIFLDKTKDLLDMFLLLVSIIIPFQITTYSLIVGIIDTESLLNIKNINSSALKALADLFDEFSTDTRSVILLGILFFVSTFIIKNYISVFSEFWLHIIKSISFFAILAIFSIVIESINVILKVGKSKLDVVEQINLGVPKSETLHSR